MDRDRISENAEIEGTQIILIVAFKRRADTYLTHHMKTNQPNENISKLLKYKLQNNQLHLSPFWFHRFASHSLFGSLLSGSKQAQ